MSRLPGEHLAEAAQRELIEASTGYGEEPRQEDAPNSDNSNNPADIQNEPFDVAKKTMGASADDVNVDVMDEEEDVASGMRPKKDRSRFRIWFEKVVPPGGLIASSFTLGSSTLGAGILGLPAAFNSMGLATALIVLVVVVVLTIFSLWLLARCAAITKVRTYEDVTRALLGKGPDYAAAVFMLGFCVGGAVSYIISIGDLLTPIFDNPNVPAFLRTKPGNRLITSMIWLVFILPLCLPKNIDALRHVSIVGVTMVCFFVVCIVQDCCTHLHRDGWRDDVKPFNTGNSAIEGLGTVMFACLVQINAMEVYFEMARPTPRNMVRNSTVAMSGCGILYVLAGVFGYARFGSTVTSSILLKYQPREAPQFWVAYFGIVIKICVAFALHQLPMRDGLYHFFSWDVYRMPWWKNAVICGFIATVMFIIGLFVPSINIVLGLVGSLCGGFIGFIFPALMIMYAGNWSLAKVGWLEWSATYFLLLTGVIAVVFGTAASVYSVL
ncbi:amino acid transporter putative (AAT19) [Leptomonas pyrrhocoris]|uniref:Amino acid transporter putative (AAT19) n=1 Tax=Leptomonas pyrrhocoris TaxID=157538 RepID=A0A0M9FQY9_LEPPY|nr:amino acid transporter putative (AAT19) [Leptomonas pyrrhocoris]XP_015652657.1 amino acid transporter putative (AAT19) [Leptomonas pyrrhocoris]KPA74217.1 amino acid transporter putative (AAT19) [Leptomonas pyrrhocoris]KPA74218.1 amino acid transporter putative (AAT19) [Leptomonas pyrrhocoris]|eukprot:XP_015652656.1 amino acid transporter putative (AAT19) [Leptomonas pyrrhocoris]